MGLFTLNMLFVSNFFEAYNSIKAPSFFWFLSFICDLFSSTVLNWPCKQQNLYLVLLFIKFCFHCTTMYCQERTISKPSKVESFGLGNIVCVYFIYMGLIWVFRCLVIKKMQQNKSKSWCFSFCVFNFF